MKAVFIGLFSVAVLLSGCGKKEEAATQTQPQPSLEGHWHSVSEEITKADNSVVKKDVSAKNEVITLKDGKSLSMSPRREKGEKDEYKISGNRLTMTGEGHEFEIVELSMTTLKLRHIKDGVTYTLKRVSEEQRTKLITPAPKEEKKEESEEAPATEDVPATEELPAPKADAPVSAGE